MSRKYLTVCIVAVSFLLQSCHDNIKQVVPKNKQQKTNGPFKEKELAINSSREYRPGTKSNRRVLGKKRKREEEKENDAKELNIIRSMASVNAQDDNTAPQNTEQKTSYSSASKKKTKRNNRALKPAFTNNYKAAKANRLDAKNVGLVEVLEKEDLLIKIASQLTWYERLDARIVNRKLHNIFSGYDQIGLRGVINLPARKVNIYSSIYEYYIHFDELRPILRAPETIPSFIFYQVMKWVTGLPKEFWPYIKNTNISIIRLNWMAMKDTEVEQLGKFLQGSKVVGVNLRHNQITYQGAEMFAQKLSQTKVRTVVLKDTKIKSQEEKIALSKKYPHIKWIF